MTTRRVTSADVARHAGVSRTTVSYVLNNRGAEFPQATRDKVTAAAQVLGYVPSASARALRRGATDLVVWLEPRWTLGHTTGLALSRLTRRVSDLGLWLLSAQERDDMEQVLAAIAPLAVLSHDALPPEVVDTLRRAGSQHFLSVYGQRDMRLTSMTHGRLLGQHLIDAGHAKLGFAGSNDPSLDWLSDMRRDGLTEIATEAQLDPPLHHRVGNDSDLAIAAVEDWRQAGVTGVAAHNDDVALAILAAGRRIGWQCPDEFAILGIDNTPGGQCSVPSLTSLDLVPLSTSDTLAAKLADALGVSVEYGQQPLTDQWRIIRRESA